MNMCVPYLTSAIAFSQGAQQTQLRSQMEMRSHSCLLLLLLLLLLLAALLRQRHCVQMSRQAMQTCSWQLLPCWSDIKVVSSKARQPQKMPGARQPDSLPQTNNNNQRHNRELLHSALLPRCKSLLTVGCQLSKITAGARWSDKDLHWIGCTCPAMPYVAV